MARLICLKPKNFGRTRLATSATCLPCRRKCPFSGVPVSSLSKTELDRLINRFNNNNKRGKKYG